VLNWCENDCTILCDNNIVSFRSRILRKLKIILCLLFVACRSLNIWPLLLPCRHFWPLNSPTWGPVRRTSQNYSQKKSKSGRSRLQRHHQLSAISLSLFKRGADCSATVNSQLSRRLCLSVEQTAAPLSTLSYLVVFV
jgi:hypothetical protein